MIHEDRIISLDGHAKDYCDSCEIKRVDNDEVCAICLDETRNDDIWCYNNISEINKQCNHLFHYTCVMNLNGGCKIKICPLCRTYYKPEII